MSMFKCFFDFCTILRMSRETQTIVRQMEDIIPIIALILAVVTILSRMSTDRIVEPINQINLIHPKQNKTYSELTPLLDKIEKQNMDIERQIKEILVILVIVIFLYLSRFC